MNEQEAREVITHWAKDYYGGLGDAPGVEVVSMEAEDDEWQAKLAVDGADHDVTFWVDDHHYLMENRLHIESLK